MGTKEKLVYVPMAVDMVHPGHLNIIRVAKKYGKVMVGLFTDEAIAAYKRLPFMTYEQRKEVIENVKGVDTVVPQTTHDYEPNLRKYRPDYMVHGTDWKEGPLAHVRERSIDVMAEWHGKVIEPEYTPGISSSAAHALIKELGTTPQLRMQRLRRLLAVKKFVRVMEAHSGLSALVVENTFVADSNKQRKEFDAFWLSSLTESTMKGKPDIELVDTSSRLETVNEIFEITTKPMIYDGDTGGHIEHFVYTVRSLERLGVSAIIIEDKCGLKMNSMFGTEIKQQQATTEEFCEKIRKGKKAQVTEDFMIIARIESLIFNKGTDDAVDRASKYIEAGADGIMIHSKATTPSEILEFCSHYQRLKKRVPLVVVPTSYSQVHEKELIAAGVNVVIYANHLIRAAYPAMVNVAKSILSNGSAFNATRDYCIPMKDFLEILPHKC
ncbi:MAG: phosphoenolpyruvate mutase [Oscillospiraceae bacterium]|jgi:phosphoenolpyruvate phosphomutase|nr:phosphoenolpyruvate mutase [Oscillospiraceae bacterium]